MKIQNLLYIVITASILGACSSSKDATKEPTEVKELDPVEVVADEGPYRSSALRVNDLIHTKLDVRFDWEKQYLYGKANLTLSPYFYPNDELKLDAKGFDINQIALVTKEGKQKLEYTYDTMQLVIKLPRKYTRRDTFEVFIDYVAKPNELTEGGSSAIISDKGLYFVNPLGNFPGKPQQIWTQGETEASSCWFPTIDHPNENTTQEIYMTVQDKYVTLSNGKLLSSTKNEDGTRTDYWKQSIPHAPYLFMMTVGEFEIIKDKWRDIDVDYYLEKDYAPYAKDIFGNTPEMMEFFSNKLKVDFPWEKYAQIIVRDFVSGAMENTTASLFYDQVQRTTKELEDYDLESIVAHELMHQWFGDLVTCESWSNLTLNEGFANYSEYLWMEHKYGRDEADEHRRREMRGYFGEAARNKKHLIRFYYDNREDMFDSHSYNKGGLVLHMLRDYLGDEAFYEGLRVYLNANKHNPVESHHLRLAFEEVVGEDMNWFFNQWFYEVGHPEITIEYAYDSATTTSTVKMTQTQDTDDGTPIFRLPIKIDIYTVTGVKQEEVVFDQQEQEFEFVVDREPNLIIVDANRSLLAKIKEEKTVAQWVHQYKYAPLYADRYTAVQGLIKHQDDKIAMEMLMQSFRDPFWGIRKYVAKNIDFEEGTDYYEEVKNYLINIAREDKDASVRSTAITRLGSTEKKEFITHYKKIIEEFNSYVATSAALEAMYDISTAEAITIAEQFEKERNGEMQYILTKMYAEERDENKQFYFEQALKQTQIPYSLVSNYGKFLREMNEVVIRNGLQTMQLYATDGGAYYIRYIATKGIEGILDNYRERIEEKKGEGTAEGASNILSEADIEKMKLFYNEELLPVLKKVVEQEKHDSLKKSYESMDLERL